VHNIHHDSQRRIDDGARVRWIERLFEGNRALMSAKSAVTVLRSPSSEASEVFAPGHIAEVAAELL
jgi:hypothetical protein